MFPGINTLIDKISDRQNKEPFVKVTFMQCTEPWLQERVVLSITVAWGHTEVYCWN